MIPKEAFVLFGGTLFGFGLVLSGMARQEAVLGFLKLEDLGLLFVLGGAALLDMVAINLVPKFVKKPLTGGEFKRRSQILDKRVIIGAAIFGVGWGISGQCPGSAVASIGTGNVPILVGVAAMFAGAYLQGLLMSKGGSK